MTSHPYTRIAIARSHYRPALALFSPHFLPKSPCAALPPAPYYRTSPSHALHQTMFARPDTSPLEALINKATDATLTADNWQFNLDVCDEISKNPETATKQAIKIITLRLATRDANVLLRTLSLVAAVAENCGSRMKQEIATKSFLFDCLLKKMTDSKIHKTVKTRIYELIMQLNDSFKTDPSLRPMADAATTMKSEYLQYSGHKPNKPAKTELSQLDKLKEEEDLQRVLKMSLQEYEREQAVKKAYLNDKPLPAPEPEKLQPQPPAEKTIATVSKVRALYDLISYEPDELSFRKGDVIMVIESVYQDWWRGSLNGKTGIFPLNYVTPVVSKSPDQLAQETELENKLLYTESRKVDHLLALLSSNSTNEDEITALYNEILPLRPMLAKSIDKYSVRREELMNLNGELSGQVKYFNQLVDSTMYSRIQMGQTNHTGPTRTSVYPVEPPAPPHTYPAYPPYPGVSPDRTGGGGHMVQGHLTPGHVPPTHTIPSAADYAHPPLQQSPYYPQPTGGPTAIPPQPTSAGFGNYLNVNSFPSVDKM